MVFVVHFPFFREIELAWIEDKTFHNKEGILLFHEKIKLKLNSYVEDELAELFSSLNELDFFKLEAISLLNAPSSWAKFLTTGLGLGFIKTEVNEDEIEVTVEVKASLEASSPSSSGIVGWLKDCFGCFLMITPEGASTEKLKRNKIDKIQLI